MSAPFELAALSPRPVALAALHPFWPAGPGPEAAALDDSIQALGLLRPLLAWDSGEELKLIGGRKRLEALKRLGRAEAPTLVLPPDMSADQALGLGLADNRDRELNPAEQALIWSFLTDLDPELAARLAPRLGLDRSPKLRQWCLAAAALPAAALAALAEGRLDLEIGARLAAWTPDDQTAALALFESLAPSKQKKKQWLDWLEDIARREQISPAEVLASADLAGALALAPARGKPAAENEARRRIWLRRHPLLAELTRRREARLRALALPAPARLELDPTLEDLSFSLNLTFATLADYQELSRLMRRLEDAPEFRALLDDADED